MKIQPRTKLDAADPLSYQPGRAGKATSATRPFQLNPLDLTPRKPGVTDAAAGASVNGSAPTDLAPFKPGHPSRATIKPLDLNETHHPIAPSSAGKTQHEQLTEKTQKWVSQTFFGTLLKQMDESPFKSELFSGGRGGQAFSSMHHEQMADRMARGAGSKLVNAIVRKIEANQAKEKDAGHRVPEAERKSRARPSSTEDPRAKAYQRVTTSRGSQSTFSLAA